MKKNNVYKKELENIIDDICDLIDYITYESGDLDRGARDTRKLFRKQLNCLQGFETPEFKSELKNLSSYISETISKGIVAGLFNTYNRCVVDDRYIHKEILPYIKDFIIKRNDFSKYIAKTLKLRKRMSKKEFELKTSNLDFLYDKILEDYYLPYIKDEVYNDGLIYDESNINKDILLDDIKELVEWVDWEYIREYYTSRK